MAFIWIIAAVIASLAQHRKILLRYGYRALFSQLNSDLDDMFLSRAARPLMPKQRFMIAWSYHRTLVRLRALPFPGSSPDCHHATGRSGTADTALPVGALRCTFPGKTTAEIHDRHDLHPSCWRHPWPGAHPVTPGLQTPPRFREGSCAC